MKQLFNRLKGSEKKNKSNEKGKKGQKEKRELSVQDLLKYDEITDRGIVRVGNSYISVLECGLINLHLLAFHENAAVWNNFRTMLNSINIRHTYILQSHFFDVSDFVKEYDEKANSLTNLTPELISAKQDVINNYQVFTEERNREQLGYIIFRYNPDVEGLEVGLETGNPTIDELIKKFKSVASEIDKEESRSIAFSILEEVSDLAYQLLYKLKIQTVRLNKVGVLNMIYSTINRDLTIHQRLQDVSEAHSFTEFKISETPDVISDTLAKIQQQDEDLFNEYFQNFNLENENIVENEGDVIGSVAN